MLKRNRVLGHRIRSRCLTPVAVTVVLAMLAGSAWLANVSPAEGAQLETTPAQPWKGASPAAQAAMVEAKSDAQETKKVQQSSVAKWITGVVVGPDGSPVAGAEIYVFAPKDVPEFPSSAWTAEQNMEWRLRNPYSTKTLGRARTEAAGQFAMELESLPEDRGVALVVLAEGFGLGYELLYRAVREKSGQTPKYVRIRLPEMVPIRGRLLTPKGTPAMGVLVRVRQLTHLPEYELIACQCRLEEPYSAVTDSPTAAASLHRDRCRQLEAANEFLPEFWPRGVLTDTEGTFSVKGMPAGCRVYLTLMHPEFAQEALAVHTGPGEMEEQRQFGPRPVPPMFTHTLKPAHPVQGVVTGADTGRPLSGVLVQVGSTPMVGRWHGAGSVWVHTDQQGRYRVNTHQYSDYWIQVFPSTDSGHLATEVGEKDQSKAVVKDFRLDRGTIIRGQVLDAETGKPICGASLVYRPSRTNSSHKKHYNYEHPALTNADGRFALTVPSGPGYLLVEPLDRSYMRSGDVGHLRCRSIYFGMRPMPCGLTPIEVPDTGTWNEELGIRLKRGRTVTLQAVGPKGERLPWVRASWQGRGAVHDSVPLISRLFPDGKVVIEGLDPGYTSRVFLLCNPAEVGAVFEITPQTGAGPIDVRLKPTGTIVGRTFAREGKPTGEAVAKLMISLDPDVSRFTKNRDLQDPYNYYWNFSRAREYGPDAAGKFAIEWVVPGVPIGLQLGWSDGSGWTPEEIMTIEPLQPGERRDMGELVVGNTSQADTP